MMQTSDIRQDRQEYIDRLNQVINHIHANLDQSLSLNELAGVAGFSPFHFHRIFKSLAGETLGEYILRARLEKSANLLFSRPEDTIINILIACGFSSPAVFSRSFRAHFRVSPSQFRSQKKSNLSKGYRNPGKDRFGGIGYNVGQSASDSKKRQMPMRIEVKELPDMHIAYIRHLQGYRKGAPDSRISQAFERICKWAEAKNLFGPNTLVIGIPHDNPEITPDDRSRYDACVTIPREIVASQGVISVQDIPGGKYAVCRIEVSASEASQIGEMIDDLYGEWLLEWLPFSGCQADDKPPLEIYREAVGRPVGTWICMDFCIPIKPL
jgi:AraC family transcriptional regulator